MENLNITTDFSLDTNTDEEFASLVLNPAVTLCKFVLTDNLPNANKKRIPLKEFDNLIKTGIFMPIKMALGQIADGHALSFPVGVISHLKKVNNQIHGLAALWDRERPEDVKLIKDRFASGKQLQLSWEIMYRNESVMEDGVTDLEDTALRAVTLVGEPAYEGRTPIIAVASITNNQEVNKLEELEQLKVKITELEFSLTAKDEELKLLNTKVSEKDSELGTLREFKSTIETEKAAIEKLSLIQTKFKSANLEKEDSYFVENKDKLLSMEPDTLDFMIQEMVSFSAKVIKDGTSSKVVVPPMKGEPNSKPTQAELLGYLQSRVKRQEK
jgi:hypothetical protein